MRSIIACTVLFLSVLCAGSLQDLRWKKRVLIVTESSEASGRKLAAAKEGLAERDIEVFVLRGDAGIGKVPDKELAAQIRERIKPKKDRPEILLIGKDGNTVIRWDASKFTTADLFSKVDSMPMRRDEMRE